MRPIRVEIEGFSAFRERVDIDFTDIDVVALVGPTGSGKSTIIDAITFALYGSVARYDDRGAVAPVINQLSPEAKVRLVFDAGGRRYTAVRVVRRTKTGASTKEARLECAGEVLAGDARGLDTAVKELLGLDFERFNKTVVLPQGKFATFLHDKPADRQQLLRELLGMGVYERLGRMARTRATVSENQLAVLEPQTVSSEDLSDERMNGLIAALAEAGTVRDELVQATARFEQLVAEQRRHEQHASALRQHAESLAEISVPDDLAALDAQISAATIALDTADEQLSDARSVRRSCEQVAKDGPSAGRIEALILQHEQLGELSERRATLADQHREALAAQTAATTAATVIREGLTAARQALDVARSERDAAAAKVATQPDVRLLEAAISAVARRDELELGRRRAEQEAEQAASRLDAARIAAEQAELTRQREFIRVPAAALASTLVLGEACPVCKQVVHETVDDDHDAAALVVADTALAAAHDALRSAQDRHARASAALSAITVELESLEQQLRATPVSDELQAQLTAAQEAHQQLGALQQQVQVAENELRAIEQSPQSHQAFATEVTANDAVTSIAALVGANTEQHDRLLRTLQSSPPLGELSAELARAHQLGDDVAIARENESAAETAVARGD